jgi:predicted RNA-binding Zn ribbon-like protein
VTDLPTWYPDADEAKPAPMPLLRVQAFLNTVDLERGVDRLADPELARDWLVDAGLVGPDRPVSAAEVAVAREVRDCLRSLLEADGGGDGGGDDDGDRTGDGDGDGGGDGDGNGNGVRGGVRAEDLEALRTLTAEHSARLTVADGGALGIACARADTVGDGLFDLLLVIRSAQEDGSWSRLKMCANPDCRWVFYDRSRNQQGNWCDMAVCGNRLKNRQLRARRR